MKICVFDDIGFREAFKKFIIDEEMPRVDVDGLDLNKRENEELITLVEESEDVICVVDGKIFFA